MLTSVEADNTDISAKNNVCMVYQTKFSKYPRCRQQRTNGGAPLYNSRHAKTANMAIPIDNSTHPCHFPPWAAIPPKPNNASKGTQPTVYTRIHSAGREKSRTPSTLTNRQHSVYNPRSKDKTHAKLRRRCLLPRGSTFVGSMMDVCILSMSPKKCL